MIAEEYYYHQEPEISIPKGKTISFVVKTIKEVPKNFISALENIDIIKPLNENKLTQVLVEQINAVLLEKEFSILALNQYCDLFYDTKGIPDIYFYESEKGKINKPLFIVESKRLPAPSPKTREKEYVIGKNKNGGIERFKIGKHGKGLNECGIVGFVEKENFHFWKGKVNSWINELSNKDNFWNEDERIIMKENTDIFAFSHSIAHRKKENDLLLYHFWIKI
ncbi:MAG: hypothetical protein U9N76_00335 [Candidatus Marinimicrobia bacterium]|nr:hypothetical protein [Candidatus Neomarinimicrobiota bacterium]